LGGRTKLGVARAAANHRQYASARRGLRLLGAYLSMTTAGVLDAILAVAVHCSNWKLDQLESTVRRYRGRELEVVAASDGMAEVWMWAGRSPANPPPHVRPRPDSGTCTAERALGPLVHLHSPATLTTYRSTTTVVSGRSFLPVNCCACLPDNLMDSQ
jgi:hypothetical protein